jgi:ABC-type antimicrobial peptide transport system permease subunit
MSVLVGLVSLASDEENAPNAGPYIAFGLALVPFVFIALAFLSEHPRAPGAVIKAMALTLLVGIPVSALAADAVTGFVAAIGAGGVVALRPEAGYSWKARWIAVLAATVTIFLLVRTAGEVALLLAPVFPFTSLGIADHLAEDRR